MTKPTCKHFDLGKTAPPEYGAFCTVSHKHPRILGEGGPECTGCEDYRPEDGTFESWLMQDENRELVNKCAKLLWLSGKVS